MIVAEWVSLFADYEQAESAFWTVTEAGAVATYPILTNDLLGAFNWTGPAESLEAEGMTAGPAVLHLPSLAEDHTDMVFPQVSRDRRLARQLARWQKQPTSLLYHWLQHDPTAGQYPALRGVPTGTQSLGSVDGHTHLGYLRTRRDFGRYVFAALQGDWSWSLLDRLNPTAPLAQGRIDRDWARTAAPLLQAVAERPVLRRLPTSGLWWTAQATGIFEGKTVLCGWLRDHRVVTFQPDPYGARTRSVGDPGFTKLSEYAAQVHGVDQIVPTTTPDTAQRAAEFQLAQHEPLPWQPLDDCPADLDSLLRSVFPHPASKPVPAESGPYGEPARGSRVEGVTRIKSATHAVEVDGSRRPVEVHMPTTDTSTLIDFYSRGDATPLFVDFLADAGAHPEEYGAADNSVETLLAGGMGRALAIFTRHVIDSGVIDDPAVVAASNTGDVDWDAVSAAAESAMDQGLFGL